LPSKSLAPKYVPKQELGDEMKQNHGGQCPPYIFLKAKS
jgi:hypothetical protein